jgi:hypothetical protein
VVFDPVIRDKVEVAAALELLHEYIDTVVDMNFPNRPVTATGNLRIEVSIRYLAEGIQAMELVVYIESCHIRIITKAPFFVI